MAVRYRQTSDQTYLKPTRDHPDGGALRLRVVHPLIGRDAPRLEGSTAKFLTSRTPHPEGCSVA